MTRIYRPSITTSARFRPAATVERATAGPPSVELQDVERVRVEAIQRRDALHRRPLALADAAAYLGSLLIGATLLGGASLTPWVIAGIPTLLVLAKLIGLYDRDENRLHKATLDEVPSLLQLATLVTLLTFVAQGALVSGQLGELEVIAIWLCFSAFLIVGRGLARSIVGSAGAPERCVVIGDELAEAELSRKFRLQGIRAEIVAVVPASAIANRSRNGTGNGNGHENGGPLIEPIEPIPPELASVVEREQIHRVILAARSLQAEDLLHSVADLMAWGIKVSVLPSTSRLATLSYEVDQLPGMALLGMRRFGMSRSSQLVKRGFDCFVAGLGLTLLSPLMGLIAVAIKLDSRGPVLFRQRRVGRGGREFEMLKFRSMVAGAQEQRDDLLHLNQASGLFKVPGDPRITRVGRLIRRWSLDELPQLVNVVGGEMSLVGPRPLQALEDAQIQGAFRRRLKVAPGMTGHWQILGAWRIPLDEMVVLDYLYAANWSLWTDLKLLARTVPFVARGRGA